jgi:basic amino acid/polyamine antiporter, APA family
VAIVFTTSIVIALLLTADVEKLANVTVLFLITVYGLVCTAALVLRRDKVDHGHYTAPTALLYAGVLFNLALLGYTAFTEPEALLYCGAMLLVGGVLFVANKFAVSESEQTPVEEAYDLGD